MPLVSALEYPYPRLNLAILKFSFRRGRAEPIMVELNLLGVMSSIRAAFFSDLGGYGVRNDPSCVVDAFERCRCEPLDSGVLGIANLFLESSKG